MRLCIPKAFRYIPHNNRSTRFGVLLFFWLAKTTSKAGGSKEASADEQKKLLWYNTSRSNQPRAKRHRRSIRKSTQAVYHTTRICINHKVVAPKYRRQVKYGKIKQDIGQIKRKLCQWKGEEKIEAEASPDHIHWLVWILPKKSESSFKGYLKGKSSLMRFDQQANMKYRNGNRGYWCRGY